MKFAPIGIIALATLAALRLPPPLGSPHAANAPKPNGKPNGTGSH